ncbi:hypothetical protein FJ251_01895 [bacterium]|nr:hypothetical protein [bacterium]
MRRIPPTRQRGKRFCVENSPAREQGADEGRHDALGAGGCPPRARGGRPGRRAGAPGPPPRAARAWAGPPGAAPPPGAGVARLRPVAAREHCQVLPGGRRHRAQRFVRWKMSTRMWSKRPRASAGARK